MKKWFCACLAAVLVLGTVTAYAEDMTPYHVEEVGMTVSLPAQWPSITRNLEENDPLLQSLGMTKTQAEQFLQERNIYLNGLIVDEATETFTGEFVLMVQENKDTKAAFNLKDIPDSDVKKIEEEGKKLTLNELQENDDKGQLNDISGMSLTFNGRLEHPQALFLRMEGNFQQSGQNVAALGYMTIVNGRQYNFYYRSYLGAITPDEQKLVEKIMDSVQFDEIQKKPSNRSTLLLAVAGVALVGVVIFLVVKKRGGKAAE